MILIRGGGGGGGGLKVSVQTLALIDVDSHGEVIHICLHGASMFSRLKR